MALRRRLRRVQDFRVDERERQRNCRRRRRDAAALGPKSPSCHAPAWAPNVTEYSVKLLAAWDAAVARSRTSLLRQLRLLLRDLRAPLGHSDLP